MLSLTLKQLRYFEALARTGQFGRAAEDCAITQPALSMQIKELEAQLGAPLVERGARQVRLTALGHQFAARAREILRAVDELGDLARADGDSLSGPLRIGVIPTVAPYLLPRLIQALQRQFPLLDPQPRETVTQRLIGDLLDAQPVPGVGQRPRDDDRHGVIQKGFSHLVLEHHRDQLGLGQILLGILPGLLIQFLIYSVFTDLVIQNSILQLSRVSISFRGRAILLLLGKKAPLRLRF